MDKVTLLATVLDMKVSCHCWQSVASQEQNTERKSMSINIDSFMDTLLLEECVLLSNQPDITNRKIDMWTSAPVSDWRTRTNKELSEIFGNNVVTVAIKSARLRCAGRVARMDNGHPLQEIRPK